MVHPYDDIIATSDRRWTSRLLERLRAPDLDAEELGKLAEALQELSDPRSFGPLEAMVCDPRHSTPVRDAASSALRGFWHIAFDTPITKLRRWWAEGDDVLRRHALLSMDGIRCPDVVLRIASDARHPWQADALGLMTWWFDLPEHQIVKIAGLSHSNPKVRETAAYILLGDEPITAEGPLLRATRDPAPEVVAEAANTLKYYPSRRTLRCLHGLRSHACEQVRRQAIESFEDVRQGIAVHLRSQDQRGAGRVRKWLQPVWDLLDFSEEELSAKEEGPPHPTAAETPDALPLSDLLELLASPETSPRSLRERLLADTWERYDEPGRRLLRPVLLNHPDQFVRDQAAQAFVAWHDAEALVALLGDSDFVVRKSAMYFLSTLPPSRGVGELAWGHLSRSDVVGIHATETLGTFVKHAEPVVAVTQLAALAGDRGQREELRTAAVRHLCRLGARHELEQLLDLLREPPVITWALQLAVLGAIVELELLLPDVSHLQEVDNLYIQVALADAGAGSPWA